MPYISPPLLKEPILSPFSDFAQQMVERAWGLVTKLMVLSLSNEQYTIYCENPTSTGVLKVKHTFMIAHIIQFNIPDDAYQLLLYFNACMHNQLLHMYPS